MRGFSDDERERIREELVRSGREALLAYGPGKTTVEDITDPVGIAKSTFYRFFDSKDELYLEVIQVEFEEYRADVEADLDETDDPREGLTMLFRRYVDFAEGNPLIQQVVLQNKYREAFLADAREELEALQRQRMHDFTPLIERLKTSAGPPLSTYETPTILGMMSVLGLLVLHREEYEIYEESYYETVKEALIETLVYGLTAER